MGAFFEMRDRSVPARLARVKLLAEMVRGLVTALGGRDSLAVSLSSPEVSSSSSASGATT